MMEKRLTKSDDKVIYGVCGGLAEYFNADPAFVRILFAVGSLLTGCFFGILVYVIIACIMPKKENIREE